ncbi:hypothetical protein DPEC_G00071680 [Dallia pectoralis]|uniref:Uncharacterized protein n=1 Tax=Dallia pectoralis TaxID=75939 RepID=A0ACC2H2C0_DALPE|nr:hypothetical protein DPEC_G00071680 [Dallia pectoralis]
MPSPIPPTRLLAKDFYPSLDFGACSSPLAKYSKSSTLRIPTQRFHGKVATRLWSSTIDWTKLHSMQSIGSGGFGSVYKGVYFEEIVAVKKVKKCVKNKLASRQSFWAELNAAHLRHTNIVRIIAATTCIPDNLENGDNIGTIVMEYAGERNLHQKLEVGGDLSSLTPQMSHGGGTYTHRAPELLKGDDVSPKSDIYSFGITLWQLITREQPYTGDRQYVLYAVVAYDLRPCVTGDAFKLLQGKVCLSILSKCWSSEPSLRPSAEDVLTDLGKIQCKL